MQQAAHLPTKQGVCVCLVRRVFGCHAPLPFFHGSESGLHHGHSSISSPLHVGFPLTGAG